jgi:hypothetical protein
MIEQRINWPYIGLVDRGMGQGKFRPRRVARKPSTTRFPATRSASSRC